MYPWLHVSLAPAWECQSQSALRWGLAAQRRRRQSRALPGRRLQMRYIYGTWATSGTDLIWPEANLSTLFGNTFTQCRTVPLALLFQDGCQKCIKATIYR